MRIVLAVAAILLAVPAVAQTPVRISGAYTPLGYCQMTSLASAVVGFNGGGGNCTGIPAGATLVQLCSEGVALRYRDDGTNPTAGVGMPINTNTCFQYAGSLSAFSVIQAAVSGILDVSFYK